jgi:hypothetical protein
LERCGINEVEGHTCVLPRDVPGRTLDPALQDQKASFRATRSVAAVRKLTGNPNVTYYIENIHPPQSCNPTTFGSLVGVHRFKFQGRGLCGGNVGTKAAFSVLMCSDSCDGALMPGTHGVIISARLVGKSIYSTIARPGVEMKDPCCVHLNVFEYTVFDPGVYWLEVMVSRVGSTLRNQLVYRGRLQVAPGIDAADAAPRPAAGGSDLCRAKDHVGGVPDGRWIRTTGFDQVNDAFHYNQDRVWQPYDCSYRQLSQRALEQCFERRGLRSIGF